jgi:ATP-dependent DNA helicase DinG
MTDAMKFFPLPSPRKSQEAVIREIQKAYSDNYKFVILEAPVGSGKSAIAITIARWLQTAHILTPRKTLQDQYYDDFKEHIVLMKGRSSYICTKDEEDDFHEQVIKWVQSGKSPSPGRVHVDCFNSPCRNKEYVQRKCTTLRNRTCPYKMAVEVAEDNDIIVHNFHSFLYQYNFAMRFNKREVLIVDEAHEMEGILRDFATVEFVVPKLIPEDLKPDISKQDLEYWISYFQTPELQPRSEVRKEEYNNSLESLRKCSEYGTGYIAKTSTQEHLRTTTFSFIPIQVGKEANSLIFTCSDKVLLMSGTIYNKDVYCRSLGITPEDAYFIRIPSSFPESSRPIICKPEYLVNTSHATWNDNKEEITRILNEVLEKFKDAKGLIHAPSYKACNEIKGWLNNPRIKTHSPENFPRELEKFYKSSGNDNNGVFLSPTCYQGVDFKQDRARFQVILRVPYSNTSDEFMDYKVKNDFPWYNHQALVTFGQQVGRINRSEDDFGVTILMDERFLKFLSRNSNVLPKWLKDSIRYK